jgi:hypothetical protein
VLIDHSKQRIEAVDQRVVAIQQQLSAELAQHARALDEAMTKRFAAGDEKYAKLPGRMDLIEATVFPAKRR